MNRFAIAGVISSLCFLLAPPAFAGPRALVLLEQAPPGVPAGWYAGADIPVLVNQAAGGEVNGIIYVAGGINGSPQSALQIYNPSTNAWTTGASLPETLYEGNGSGTIDGKLYVAGGWNGPLPTSTLFVYDPHLNSWASKASMPHLSGCGMTAVIATRLYVSTACDGFSGYRNDFDVYDSVANAWTSLSGSTSVHGDGAMAAINGKLYATSGIDSAGALNRVTEVYDPATGSWTVLAKIPKAVRGAAGFSWNGLLCVVGGNVASGDDSVLVQLYDPATNTWSTALPRAPVARSYASGALVYGRPFVIGGSAGGTLTGMNSNLADITPIP